MTKRQKEVLDFLKEYLKNNGVAPTMREAGEYLKVSIATVQSHFKNLEIKGYITRSPNDARAIKIGSKPRKIISTKELINKVQELENRLANLELMS